MVVGQGEVDIVGWLVAGQMIVVTFGETGAVVDDWLVEGCWQMHGCEIGEC